MLDQLRERLAAAIRPKQAQASSIDIDSLYRMLLFRAPPSRTMPELISGYQKVPEFRAVVSKIADHVASVSWRLYVVRGRNGKARKVRAASAADPLSRRKMLTGYKRTGELEEIEDHPMAMLFDRANPLMSGFSARRLCQIHLDVVGESTSVLSRNALGVPEAYWPMPPSWIVPPENNRDTFELRIRGKSVYVLPEDMMWIRDMNPSDPYGRGSGIGESLGDELDISEFSAGYVKSFFYNSGRPEFIIGLEGAEPEDLKRLKQSMDEQHRGWRRAHRPLLVNTKLDVKEMTAKFGDMQVVQLKGAVRDTFVNTIGIPPEILGIITNSNRATIREAMRMFVIEVIVPRLERHRDELQHVLAPSYDDRLIVDYDNPVPVDQQDQLNAMKAASWAATRGEWREAQGLEHRGEIDEVHAVPLNLIFQKPGDVGVSVSQPDAQVLDEPKSAGYLPVVSKDDAQTVENILEALRPERLTYETEPIWKTEIDEWGNSVLADLGVGANFNMLNPLVVEHLAEFAGDRISGLVDETTRNALRNELIEGVRAGESVRDLAARVRGVFDGAEGYRAERIARTEVNSSANFATYSAHRQSGVVQRRGWLTTRDGNARDEHEAVPDPYIVGIDEPFIVGGEQLMYPGDGNGSPWNVISCRCTTYADIGEPRTLEQLDAEWKIFDRRLVPWERAAVEAFRRGFRRQRAEVLAQLGRVLGNGRQELHAIDKIPNGIAFM
jgi:HK97 family phage portal protein